MSSEISIAVRNISKSYNIYEKPQDRLKQMLWRNKRRFYDEFWALQEINFELNRGETVGIVGRNGSGKSTLLQIICGTVTPTTGSVIKNGRVSALLELGSGFNPEFSGRENVYLSGALLGLTTEQITEKFEEISAFADIGEFIDSPVKHYSSGMFARLAFSVAIHVDPEILIVDEILAVGDAAFQRRCIEKFYEVRNRGCSILFVSHDQYQIKSICQRALYLQQGRQVMFGAAGRVIDQYSIDMEINASQAREKELQVYEARIKVQQDKVEDALSAAEVAVEQTPAVSEIVAKEKTVTDKKEIFRITQVQLTDETGNSVDEVVCGDTVYLISEFIAVATDIPDKISFVFNLYRHDDFYICGTTTLMDNMLPHQSGRAGKVKIKFSKLPLLSGQYKWRVAINDHGGFVVLAEAKNVCEFRVIDNFNAVGMLNLDREWSFDIQS